MAPSIERPPLVPLRLVTWNLHGAPFVERRRERMTAAAHEIMRRAPDLVVLQEVWFQEDADTLVGVLGSVYHAIDIAQDAWLGRKGGLLAFLRKSGAFATERRVARYERFDATASALKVWQGDGLSGKGIQIIELRHRPSGQALVVLNTHLQAQYGEDRYMEVRQSQLDQLNAVAKTIGGSVPVLAAGDLNTMPEENSLYAKITGTWEDLTTALREQCRCGTAIHEHTVPPADHEWIDYVLARREEVWDVSGRIDIIRNVAVDDPFSDHDGLDAIIDIRRAAGASVRRRALAALVLLSPVSRRTWLSAAGVLLLDSFLPGLCARCRRPARHSD